jgi:hypothetical protein
MTPVPLHRTCASLSVNVPRMCIELPRRSLSAAASAFGHLHTIPSRLPTATATRIHIDTTADTYTTPLGIYVFLPSIDDNLYIWATETAASAANARDQ